MRKLVIDNHKALSWNTMYAGMHWTGRRKIAEEIHNLVYAEGLWQGLPKWKEKIDISLVAYLKRPIDSDNIASKIYVDGLKYGGFIKDDSPKYVGWVKTLSVKDVKNWLIITIEPHV